ncbi:MotE family protein [Halovulum sp. GXIMD14793]
MALLIACFLVSGGLRVLTVGQAYAEQAGNAPETPEMAAVDCPPPEDADVLLTVVQERAQQLDERDAKMAERLAVLQIAEAEFEKRRDELIAAEEKLAATLAIADNAAERDIQQLTAVYEEMKPKNAAEIFDSMDPAFAAGFLIRMAPQSAANILSAMDKNTAYTTSVIMASRNVGAPKE